MISGCCLRSNHTKGYNAVWFWPCRFRQSPWHVIINREQVYISIYIGRWNLWRHNKRWRLMYA